MSSFAVLHSFAIEGPSFEKAQALGEVRRPAIVKFSIWARGQVRAITFKSLSIMKKARLLLLCGALVSVFACQKDPIPETPSKDAELSGIKVDVSTISTTAQKIVVLKRADLVRTIPRLIFYAFPMATTSREHSKK